MKIYLKRILVALGIMAGAFVLSTVIAACNGSAEADSGVTVSQFNALKAQVASLQKDVDALQSQSGDSGAVAELKSQLWTQAVVAESSASTASRSTESLRHVESAATTTTSVGTIVGYAPAGAGPLESTAYVIANDTTGVRAVVSMGDAGEIGDQYTFLYESPDCQGRPYLGFSTVPRQANPETLAAGLVLRIADSYWFLKPNTAPQSINMMSKLKPSGACVNSGTPFPQHALAIIQNDQSVSGWASAPAGTVVRGTPQ